MNVLVNRKKMIFVEKNCFTELSVEHIQQAALQLMHTGRNKNRGK